jgi:hypothetical protein
MCKYQPVCVTVKSKVYWACHEGILEEKKYSSIHFQLWHCRRVVSFTPWQLYPWGKNPSVAIK